MRVCPAGSPVKAHAPALSRFPTSGFGRRSREVHRGGIGSKPIVAPQEGRHSMTASRLNVSAPASGALLRASVTHEKHIAVRSEA